MALVMHAAIFLPLPAAAAQMINRAEGWPDYAAHIERARAKYKTSLLIANHYSQASMAQFCLADHPTVYLPTGSDAQYKLWGDYLLAPDARALFITTDIRNSPAELGLPLTEQFKTLQLVDDFWTQHRGQNMNHIQIYLLTRIR